jgi:hypothetical protein
MPMAKGAMRLGAHATAAPSRWDHSSSALSSGHKGEAADLVAQRREVSSLHPRVSVGPVLAHRGGADAAGAQTRLPGLSRTRLLDYAQDGR